MLCIERTHTISLTAEKQAVLTMV